MSTIEVYDSDIIKMETVLNRLRQLCGEMTDMEGFRLRAVDAFAEIGFHANVKCFSTTEPGVYAFDVDIVGRTEAHEFDHDKQAIEVQRAILGIDQPGTILPDGTMVDPSRSF